VGETKISKAIADMIKKEFADDVFIDRHQCGILRLGKRFIHCGKKGVSDRIGFFKRGQYAGKFIGIEVKTPDGKQAKAQVEFQEMVEAANCFYLLVESVEDCREQLKKILGEQQC
jgi:hypothetical protein